MMDRRTFLLTGAKAAALAAAMQTPLRAFALGRRFYYNPALRVQYVADSRAHCWVVTAQDFEMAQYRFWVHILTNDGRLRYPGGSDSLECWGMNTAFYDAAIDVQNANERIEQALSDWASLPIGYKPAQVTIEPMQRGYAIYHPVSVNATDGNPYAFGSERRYKVSRYLLG
jgi:hypothetical protein